MPQACPATFDDATTYSADFMQLFFLMLDLGSQDGFDMEMHFLSLSDQKVLETGAGSPSADRGLLEWQLSPTEGFPRAVSCVSHQTWGPPEPG